ncbi:single-stranded DNA-binding protein [Chitinophaga horti]|uniref:Single-stranded DNA-binding protein n=1 Tax=Chitinophaga horti TaxID=2920382 RepID=A0ABY6IXR9_9BACT|nr:single-stranded DNA-binding protein [Chitinophaga horti]UYQ92179.1 single-stranded DNA-binding protein [Chitinophaga horti]
MDTRIGRVTADAKVKHFESGKAVVNFSLAVDTSYSDKEGKQIKRTQFVECALWQREIMAQYLTKGKLIFIEGDLDVRAYIKNGEAIGVNTMNVTGRIKFLSGSSTSASDQQDAAPAAVASEPVPADDDLPF